MSCGNCKGLCCDPIVLTISPQEITEAYINCSVKTRPVANEEEVIKMYRNLTFKGASRFSPMEKGVYPNGVVRYMYSCKNFDYETRKCTDYENRMEFCKAYGETKECKYQSCSE